MDKRGIIIFSGYNQRAVISFLRTLNKNKLYNYGIVASSENDTIFLTEYKNKVLYTRTKEKLELEDFVNIVNIIKEKLNIIECLIAPSTEFLNRFLLTFRKQMEKINVIIPLVEENLYIDISDKLKFSNICKENFINIPKEISFPYKFKSPFVAKPKAYFSKFSKDILSPVIINCIEDYNIFKSKYKLNDFYFQEYIIGKSYYLLYYITKEGDVYKFSQENLAQQPNGKSILAAQSSNIHDLKISDLYQNMLIKMKFYGFIMIEIREREGLYYMIEANPRFWGPSQLFCDAQVNFFEVFLKEYGFLNSFEINSKFSRYYWSGGICETLKSYKNVIYYSNSELLINESISEWINIDIYNRNDTRKIFNIENKN